MDEAGADFRRRWEAAFKGSLRDEDRTLRPVFIPGSDPLLSERVQALAETVKVQADGIAGLYGRASNHRSDVAALFQSVTAVEGRLTNHGMKLAEARNDLDAVERRLGAFAARMDEHGERLQDRKNDSDALIQRGEAWTETLVRLEERIRGTSMKLDEVTRHVNTTQERMSRRVAGHSSSIGEVERAVERLDERLTQVESAPSATLEATDAADAAPEIPGYVWPLLRALLSGDPLDFEGMTLPFEIQTVLEEHGDWCPAQTGLLSASVRRSGGDMGHLLHVCQVAGTHGHHRCRCGVVWLSVKQEPESDSGRGGSQSVTGVPGDVLEAPSDGQGAGSGHVQGGEVRPRDRHGYRRDRRAAMPPVASFELRAPWQEDTE